MKIPKEIPFFGDDDINEIVEEVKKILKSKRLVLGPYTQRLEQLFSEYVGTKYAIALSSCTAALQIALEYFDVRESEVIVPTNTFIACPNAVLYAGAKPIFAEVDPDTFCLDVDDVRKKVNKKTRAIMAVHLGGLPVPDIRALMDLCHDHKLYLIEDCSHAHGAMIDSRKVGSLGDAGCFSFFATKMMATGTGGIITTDDSGLMEFAQALRHQGGVGGAGMIERFDKLGYDWMMSEVTAAIAISQLSKLECQLKVRNEIAAKYRSELEKISAIRSLPIYDGVRHSYWRFITKLDEGIDREMLKSTLRSKHGIEAGVLYPVLCHLQPVYMDMGHRVGECPVAEEAIRRQLTLPINSYMKESDLSYVLEALDLEISSGDLSIRK